MAEAFTSSPILSTALAGTVAYLGFKAAKFGSRESFLPPGPPTTPVLGNLLDYPKEGPHHQFTKWAETYGPIYSLKLGNATVVVLNHPDIVKHVMDKNSVLSSDRPAYHFGEIVEGIDNDIVLARYSPKWRSLRRAAHEILSPQACRIHLAIQQAEATQLSYEILIDPKGFKNHLRRYANSTIMTLMYGNRIPRSSVPIAQEFWEMQAMWIDLTAPTSHPPVDLIPILKKVPERFARWKTLCKDVRRRQRSIYTRLLEQVESRLARGEGNGCFMETVCSRAEEWNLDRENLLYFGTVMIAAGSDTTSVFLQTMILLLITHPEIQRKAQEEMDAVIGLERMPVVDDLERLPYINAVLTETHRFRPTAPLSVPHAASEDIVCDQYVIPKGAVIWQNTWGIFHDETIFENHDKFVPERFLKKPELAKIVEYAFGSGRRVCAGVHLAKNSIVINALNLIWGFNFTKAVGANGREIDLNLDNFDDGLVNAPKDFECTIKPRSAQHEAILRQEFRNTASSFQPFEQDLSAEDRAYAVDSRNRA